MTPLQTYPFNMIRDTRGAAVVEFALAVPTLLIIFAGLFDLAHNMYAQSVLQGSMHEASRYATIENADRDALDNQVLETVKAVAPGAKITFTRKAYSQFGDMSRPEDFTDSNGDGICNNGESFEDANRNGTYDEDRGVVGGGGSRDAILYTATMRYERAFPVAGLLGFSDDYTGTASTVLRNQPYDNTEIPAPPVGSCT